jgi:hypothetical protein
MHSNKESVVSMMSNFSSNPVAYTYGYIRKVKHFSEQCARKCVATWFIYSQRIVDSNFNTITNLMTSRVRSSYTVFEKDMKEASCLEIPAHILNEIDIRLKNKEDKGVTFEKFHSLLLLYSRHLQQPY